MRYSVKREYKKYDICGDSILWQCSIGDCVDVVRVSHINVAKIINRNSISPLSTMWMNTAMVEEFIDRCLVNLDKVE